MNGSILKGVRVLDFTRVLSGPYCTRILADFGAEVIKVQSKRVAKGVESNIGAYFNAWNRNKRSITLDMSHPEARRIVLMLTEISDVVVENFSPRVMSNWGLEYDNLKEVRPDLIMIALSGMGQTGPWKDFVAFAPTVQSLGGLTYLTSFDRDSPSGPGYSYADMISGIYGALAVLAALEYRDRTDQGQYIDLSEYEAICSSIGPMLMDISANHGNIPPSGNRSDHMEAAPYGCYRCLGRERWCVIAVFNEPEWKALCDVLGHPEWAGEERFSSISRRRSHAKKLDELLAEWTSQRTGEEVFDLLQKACIPVGIVQNAEDLAKDPHLHERGAFVDLQHPFLGHTTSDRLPIKFERSTFSDWSSAPLIGEDNRYVYTELLGLTDLELSSYIKKGIIA